MTPIFNSECRDVEKLSEKRVLRALKDFGLTEVDAQVYVFLSKQGPHKMSETALALNLPEKMIERSLKELEEISLLRASIDYPLEYVAIPFEELITFFIEVKREQAKNMQENREELLFSWKETIKKEIVKTGKS